MDHKEALQAFVNKAAAVLLADEDLRQIQIIEESVGHKEPQNFDLDIEKYSETSSLEFCEQNLVDIKTNEVLPNIQIIVPPEEFCNQIIDSEESKVVSDSSTQISVETEEIEETENIEEMEEEEEKEDMSLKAEVSAPEECSKMFPIFDLTIDDDNDSIASEMEFIDKILNEVENEQKSQQLMVCEIEDEIQREDEFTFRPLEPPMEMNVVCNEISDTSIKPIIEEQIECEEMKTNEMVLKDETQNDIQMIDESNKTIEEKVDSVVNTLEAIDSTKNSFEANDNTIDNELNCDNEKDLFEDIDELNREIEALEELVEYEIKMESLKESQNSKTKEDKENVTFNIIEQTVNNCNHNKTIDKSVKRGVERENSVQSQNGNKYSPPMSLIPRRLPSATPRKSKSYGNLPALYAAFKTSDKKPSLIPRPVSKTNINSPTNNKNESPLKPIHSLYSPKVQNSKTAQKSKTRILSERKKNEVLNSHSNETKRTFHLKPAKSALKCKSLMDLTTAFSSGKKSIKFLSDF